MEEAQGAATFRTSATSYDRHIGRYSTGLAEALIAAAGIARGSRALDVGCGPGGLTEVLAERLGPRNVAAVDPSEPFVEACRARVPGADVRVAAAEALPFEDAEFDAVLSQLVINFLGDPARGVREMRRVARPGSAVGACVWDYAGEMTLLRVFWDAAVDLEPALAEPYDERTRMRHCRPGELRALWEEAGLEAAEVGEIVVGADYESFDDLWAPFLAGVAPSGAYCASLEPARQEALRAEYFRRLGSPSGPFRLAARAWLALGTA